MSTNFSLSLELVYLMAWLLKNEKVKIKNLINETIKKGFAAELAQIEIHAQDDLEVLDSFHLTILDFLIFLENSLFESLKNKDFDVKTQEKLKPTLQKINLQNIDIKTLWLSAQQTKTLQLQKNNTNEEINKILLSQLLKNWKPRDEEPLN